MYRILILLFLITSNSIGTLYAQGSNEILCKIVELGTNYPVSYATIQFKDKGNGVIANIDGDFRIPIRYKTDNETLIISCIGYETKMVELSTLRDNTVNSIFLKPKIEALDSVIINANSGQTAMTAREIIRKAVQKIPVNYPNTPFSSVDLSVAHNLSISILPSETKSYVHHQNIVSSVFVKPFIKDPLENVRTYLTHITDKKRYQLNLLLLSQGQSRYNWNQIFNNPPDYIYDFEMGINYTVNLNSAKTEGIFIYPNADTKSELVTISDGQKAFSKLGMFPYDNEKIRMGELNENGELGKAQLFLQFTPSQIPVFKNSYEGVTVQSSFQSANTDFTSLEFKGIDNYEKLDEVKVEAKKAYTRLEKLRNVTLGKVEEFDDDMRRQYKTFAQYIHTRGFYVEETLDIERQTGELTIFRIYNRKTTSFANNIPLIYLDNALLNNLDILHRFKMDIVDYIEVNSAGIGEGIRGGAGVIKIFTDPKKVFRVEPKDSYTEYEIPLKFSRPKPFFVPNYPSFSSGFFKEFGVIDWIPNA